MSESENIYLQHVMDEAMKDPFPAIRGFAIQAYANLEQSLCRVFAHLGSLSPNVAGIIFFKITNARAVHEIIHKLLSNKYAKTYSIFWNSVKKFTEQIAQRRNEIVHWNTVVHISGQGFSHLCLSPPNVWGFNLETPQIKVTDLLDFIDKCEFVTRLCNMFLIFLNEESRKLWPEDQAKTWSDIFQQALTYPPPSTHPLHQNSSKSETQHPSSPGSPNTSATNGGP